MVTVQRPDLFTLSDWYWTRIAHPSSASRRHFFPSPQRVEIKTEIIAVGFADLRSDPGKELVLLSNSGVFSLSTAREGYAGNIRQLFEWELIAAIPDLEQVQFFDGVEDINRDGKVDFLLQEMGNTVSLSGAAMNNSNSYPNSPPPMKTCAPYNVLHRREKLVGA